MAVPPPTTRTVDTGTDDLLCRIEDHLAVVTLNRPDARNALSPDMKEAMRALLPRLAGDSEVRCLLLTGAGKAFCAGGDTKSMARGDAIAHMDDRIRRVHKEHEVPAALHELPIPVLAALPGAAAGAGFSLALACDLRIAARSAFLTTSFARVGLSGDYGGSWFLTRLVGPAKARELYFLSERIDAEECQRLGLFNWVVPDDDLEATALEIAGRIAAGPPIAHRYMKENLNRALDEDLRTCLGFEADRQVRGAFSEDYQEAVAAFVAKRTPVFRDR
jgi:2-(1,2-epoxy-1,2-dihydrophenyl)acetyl-CoA isomerase